MRIEQARSPEKIEGIMDMLMVFDQYIQYEDDNTGNVYDDQ